MFNPELVFPKPLKPKFRYPKSRPRLTTVIAVQCRDGIVLCADMQETQEYAGLGTKEFVSKIAPVTYQGKDDGYCLLGCSGIPDYINSYKLYVGEEILNRSSNTNYHEALDRASERYSKYVKNRSRGLGLPDALIYPSSIFVGYDPSENKTHICVTETPNPPSELASYPYRAAIGTGKLYASLLFSIAELMFGKIDLTWNALSTIVVAQFCYLVLGRILNYDEYSGLGTSFYRIDAAGRYESLELPQIFPNQGTGENQERHRLTIFMKTLIAEKALPKDKMVRAARSYKLDEVMRLFFASEK
jgi:20S proteasome alpha/beta subunit